MAPLLCVDIEPLVFSLSRVGWEGGKGQYDTDMLNSSEQEQPRPKSVMPPRLANTCNAYFPLEPIHGNPTVIPTDVRETLSFLINRPV